MTANRLSNQNREMPYAGSDLAQGSGGGQTRHQQTRQQASQQRYDSLLSMRKHRSLDGAQFLSQFESPAVQHSPHQQLPSTSGQYGSNPYPVVYQQPYPGGRVPPPPPPPFSGTDNYYYDGSGSGGSYFDPYLLSSDPMMAQQSHQQMSTASSTGYIPPGSFTTIEGGGRTTSSGGPFYHQPQALSGGFNPSFQSSKVYGKSGGNYGAFNQPASAYYRQGVADSSASDYEMLRREHATMNQKLAYVMNSIRTFWSPELKKERQLRKEEALRINTLHNKLAQQAAEIQWVRNELEKREKDIGQLLSESDLADMEEELRKLRKQLRDESTASVTHLPRDFTAKAPTLHELQTVKSKMERSELTLAERMRDLHNCETRLKCAEEQNAELEKRNDYLTRTNAANEAQLKLLHDDLDALRRKLETKNQMLESREKTGKAVEKELEAAKARLQESAHTIQENEHRIAQLTHRIDQLETLLRDKDSLAERLKLKLQQSPDTRAEAELQQRLENAERDKQSLERAIDALQQGADVEKQNQYQAFQEETLQFRSTIENLQKELADRHILIVSQNEKISQLGGSGKSHQQPAEAAGGGLMASSASQTNGIVTSNLSEDKNRMATATPTTVSPHITSPTTFTMLTKSACQGSATTDEDASTAVEQLEVARNEIDRLLRIVRDMEAEKSALSAKLNALSAPVLNGNVCGTTLSSTAATKSAEALVASALNRTGGRSGGDGGDDQSADENSALRMRIEALEEALRESVGITAERDRLIADQKQLIQQLANQVSELYKNSSCGGGRNAIETVQKAALAAAQRAADSEKALADERSRYQRQLAAWRKEVAMAVIREKDACIQLLRGPPNTLKEKVDVLVRQKEQLKHQLLASGDASPVGGDGGGDLLTDGIAMGGGGYPHHGSHYPPSMPTKAASTLELGSCSTAFYGGGTVPMYGGAAAPTATTSVASAMAPININVPPTFGGVTVGGPVGYSAPASLNYATAAGERDENNFEDDGIWA